MNTRMNSPRARIATMTTPLARILAIAAYTALPLVGVLVGGWDWREVLALYWFENVSLGVAMVVRMVRAARTPATPAAGPAAHAFLIVFFTLHYGIFTLVHGVFVFAIIGGAFTPNAAADAADTAAADAAAPMTTPLSSMDWSGILLVWIIGGLVQVLVAAFGPLPPEHQRGTVLMMSAYPRIVVLHLAVLGSAFLITALGLPAIAAVLLIVLHGLVDAAGWMLASRRERRPSTIAGRASTTGSGPAPSP